MTAAGQTSFIEAGERMVDENTDLFCPKHYFDSSPPKIKKRNNKPVLKYKYQLLFRVLLKCMLI